MRWLADILRRSPDQCDYDDDDYDDDDDDIH